MAKYKEQLQRVWHKYEAEHGAVPATAREAVVWGITQGMIEMPEVDPFDKLASDMATALREEYATDNEGRSLRLINDVKERSLFLPEDPVTAISVHNLVIGRHDIIATSDQNDL